MLPTKVAIDTSYHALKVKLNLPFIKAKSLGRNINGRMARVGYGLPKVLPGPALQAGRT
jgi:hypothetical protein